MSQRIWEQVEEMFEILLFGKKTLEDDSPSAIAPVCPTPIWPWFQLAAAFWHRTDHGN